MTPLLRSGILILALMFTASALAYVLRPPLPDPNLITSANLAERIPAIIGEWHLMESGMVMVNPQETEALDKIYSDVLNRTYRHTQSGNIIMLSIAYGAVQNKQSQVHRPDVCYPAQGFQIVNSRRDVINTPNGSIAVRRLVAKADKRTEPLTYWIRVGDRLAQGWIEQKYAVVMEGLAGRVSDGLIFRVSSINEDTEMSFITHDRFVNDLLQSISTENASFLFGSATGNR